MGQQPRAQRLDGDQAALADLDALEGAGPERVVNCRPAQSGQPRRLAGDTASGSALGEGGRRYE